MAAFNNHSLGKDCILKAPWLCIILHDVGFFYRKPHRVSFSQKKCLLLSFVSFLLWLNCSVVCLNYL